MPTENFRDDPPDPENRRASELTRAALPRALRPRRALPGWAIDLIRDGVSREDFQERGQRAVWDALGRTALAAINVGHSRPDWEYEVTRPVSKLGLQNRLKADGKERTTQAATKSLNSAWLRAEKYATESPAWTREIAREESHKRTSALRAAIADPDLPLTDSQRDLLQYAGDKAAKQGSVSVNLPRAATAAATGLGEKAVRIHLDRLVELGLLDLAERGRARTKSRPGLANSYRLPDDLMLRRAVTSLSRETRQVGPSRVTGRPQAEETTGPSGSVGAHLPYEAKKRDGQVPGFPRERLGGEPSRSSPQTLRDRH